MCEKGGLESNPYDLVEIPENLKETTKFLTSLEPPAYGGGSSPGQMRWACKLAAQLA